LFFLTFSFSLLSCAARCRSHRGLGIYGDSTWLHIASTRTCPFFFSFPPFPPPLPLFSTPLDPGFACRARQKKRRVEAFFFPLFPFPLSFFFFPLPFLLEAVGVEIEQGHGGRTRWAGVTNNDFPFLLTSSPLLLSSPSSCRRLRPARTSRAKSAPKSSEQARYLPFLLSLFFLFVYSSVRLSYCCLDRRRRCAGGQKTAMKIRSHVFFFSFLLFSLSSSCLFHCPGDQDSLARSGSPGKRLKKKTSKPVRQLYGRPFFFFFFLTSPLRLLSPSTRLLVSNNGRRNGR